MSYFEKIDSKFSASTARNHKNRLSRLINAAGINNIENNAKKTLEAIDNMTDARSK